MNNINIYKYSNLSKVEINNLCKRAESDLSEYYEIVENIIDNVKINKNDALVEYSLSLDKVDKPIENFKVTESEISLWKQNTKKIVY